MNKELWSTGVATEAASAVLDLAFGRFALSRVVAIIVPEHAASRRVAEKLGMREESTAAFDGELVAVYELSASAARRCSRGLTP